MVVDLDTAATRKSHKIKSPTWTRSWDFFSPRRPRSHAKSKQKIFGAKFVKAESFEIKFSSTVLVIRS